MIFPDGWTDSQDGKPPKNVCWNIGIGGKKRLNFGSGMQESGCIRAKVGKGYSGGWVKMTR